jgi:hypothetical protein
MTPHGAVWLLPVLTCLGVPLLAAVCATAVLAVAGAVWREAV